MSYYGEGTMCRRADVLHAEANELAACIVAIGELLGGALEVHRAAPRGSAGPIRSDPARTVPA